MVPCFICGKDATGAFIHGYVASPDGQKVGLCAAHNTTENKKKAILHWIRAQKAGMAMQIQSAEFKNKAPARYNITIRYTDGGIVTHSCLAWDVTDQSTLQITLPDKTLTFIPLQHVRQFDIKEADGSQTEAPPKTIRPGT